MNISNILGDRYDSIEEAKEFVIPGQLVVTDNGKTFYIVKPETLIQDLHWTNYTAI